MNLSSRAEVQMSEARQRRLILTSSRSGSTPAGGDGAIPSPARGQGVHRTPPTNPHATLLQKHPYSQAQKQTTRGRSRRHVKVAITGSRRI